MVEPNLQSIVITNAIGLVLLVCLLVTSYLTRERKHLHDRIFTLAILVCGGACIFEPITWLVDGHAEPWAFALNYLGNTYCYLATNIYAYVWVLYVDLRLHRGSEHILRQFKFLLVPTVVLSIAIIGNLFGHYMFTIDENNVYSREPLSYLNYVMTFVMLFYSMWLKRKYERTHGKVQFFPIGAFLVPILIGAGLQAVVFGVSLAWTSVSIALVTIHMSQQNELSYIDPLTNLYNRTYLDYSLQGMQRGRGKNAGIMVDLDFFKEINDTHGHSAGDRALRQAADLIKRSVPENALVIRFAGDEFIVLLNAADDAEAQAVETAIAEAAARFNRISGEPYELSLSMGHGLFRAGEDSIDAFLRRIDERMYAQKRIHHQSRESALPGEARPHPLEG